MGVRHIKKKSVLHKISLYIPLKGCFFSNIIFNLLKTINKWYNILHHFKKSPKLAKIPTKLGLVLLALLCNKIFNSIFSNQLEIFSFRTVLAKMIYQSLLFCSIVCNNTWYFSCKDLTELKTNLLNNFWYVTRSLH